MTHTARTTLLSNALCLPALTSSLGQHVSRTRRIRRSRGVRLYSLACRRARAYAQHRHRRDITRHARPGIYNAPTRSDVQPEVANGRRRLALRARPRGGSEPQQALEVVGLVDELLALARRSGRGLRGAHARRRGVRRRGGAQARGNQCGFEARSGAQCTHVTRNRRFNRGSIPSRE